MSSVEISCCMIVKNEEAHLRGCIQSLFQEVDEIVIVDTGSTDKTKEIATSFGAKVRLFEFPWRNDFSEARNASLREARGSWVLIIDADERLNSLGRRNILRDLARVDGVDAYYVGIRSFNLDGDKVSGSFDWAVRFFKKLPEIEFSGIIHESVFPSLLRRGSIIKNAPFIIDHFGYELSEDQLRLKLERNFKLALKQIRRTPKDPYFLYHLALPALQLGKRHTAARIIDKAHQIIKKSNNKGEAPLHCFILNLKARILLEEGKYQEALEIADDSLSLIPRQRSARIVKGVAYALLQKWDEAIPWLEEALHFQILAGDPFRDPSRLSMELSMPLDKIKQLLARCYANIGQHQKALDFISEEDAEILPILTVIAMEKGDLEGATTYLSDIKSKKLPLPVESLLKPFWEILNSSESSPPTIKNIIKFLRALAGRPDWKEVLSPFLDLIVAQEKDSWFCESNMEDDLNCKKLLILLALKKENLEEAIRQSLSCVKNIMAKSEISHEDQDMLKLHAGLLLHAGKQREATSFIRMLERIKGIRL